MKIKFGKGTKVIFGSRGRHIFAIHKSVRRFTKQVTQEARRPGFRLGLQASKTRGTSPIGGAPLTPRISTTEGAGPKATARQDLVSRTQTGIAALTGAVGLAGFLIEQSQSRSAADAAKDESRRATLLQSLKQQELEEETKRADRQALADKSNLLGAARRKQQQLRRAASSRLGTKLTGPLGLTGTTATGGGKTLLGR